MGEIDVDALLARLSSRQISEWMAYYTLDPFGEERADLRFGMLMALLANMNRDPEKRREPYTAEEFMPKFGEPPSDSPRYAGGEKGQSWEQQKALLKAMNGSNAKALRI